MLQVSFCIQSHFQSIRYAWIEYHYIPSTTHKVRRMELKTIYKWVMAAMVAPTLQKAGCRGITRISVFKFLDFMIILHYFSLKIFISPVYYFWYLLSEDIPPSLRSQTQHFIYLTISSLSAIQPDPPNLHSVLSRVLARVTHFAQFLSPLLTTHNPLSS